jgi:hypothetical protein
MNHPALGSGRNSFVSSLAGLAAAATELLQSAGGRGRSAGHATGRLDLIGVVVGMRAQLVVWLVGELAELPTCCRSADHRSTNSSGPINSFRSESAAVFDSRLSTSNVSSPTDPTFGRVRLPSGTSSASSSERSNARSKSISKNPPKNPLDENDETPGRRK